MFQDKFEYRFTLIMRHGPALFLICGGAAAYISAFSWFGPQHHIAWHVLAGLVCGIAGTGFILFGLWVWSQSNLEFVTADQEGIRFGTRKRYTEILWSDVHRYEVLDQIRRNGSSYRFPKLYDALGNNMLDALPLAVMEASAQTKFVACLEHNLAERRRDRCSDENAMEHHN